MRNTIAHGAFIAILLLGASSKAAGEVELAYVGHSCFVIESPSGVRVVIDPYNGKRWLGYGFPDDVVADAVLVSHPHYDHDASYYFAVDVPVFRKPGTYGVGDVTILGVKGRHAGTYGKDFEHENTIWLLEADGLRLAHLGDNGPLAAENLRELGRVDVLLLPADGLDHILTADEIGAIRKSLQPRIVIPMHYRLDGFLGLPASLGPVDPWLEKQRNVVRLGRDRVSLTPPLDGDARVMVFEPSPSLRAWPDALASAWQKLDEARAVIGKDPGALAQAAELVNEAYRTEDSILFAFQWASLLRQTGRSEEAIAVLQSSLARAARDDWEYRMRAHSLLGEIYQATGHTREAAEQHRIVLQSGHRTELLEKARSYIASKPD